MHSKIDRWLCRNVFVKGGSFFHNLAEVFLRFGSATLTDDAGTKSSSSTSITLSSPAGLKILDRLIVFSFKSSDKSSTSLSISLLPAFDSSATMPVVLLLEARSGASLSVHYVVNLVPLFE